MDLCQAELDAGKFCLLVEHSDHFTIWQQAIEVVGWAIATQCFQGSHGGS
ncbi:MAG TPA: hypothetical protein V6D14_17050 [Coleofasciculaceae cyanobacterium]